MNAAIVFVNGAVTVNDVDASAGTLLQYGDVIKTSDNGICRIQIGDKNVLHIGKSSKLVFNISDKGNELLLNKRWLGCITRKIFTTGGKCLVKHLLLLQAYERHHFMLLPVPVTNHTSVCVMEALI